MLQAILAALGAAKSAKEVVDGAGGGGGGGGGGGPYGKMMNLPDYMTPGLMDGGGNPAESAPEPTPWRDLGEAYLERGLDSGKPGHAQMGLQEAGNPDMSQYADIGKVMQMAGPMHTAKREQAPMDFLQMPSKVPPKYLQNLFQMGG